MSELTEKAGRAAAASRALAMCTTEEKNEALRLVGRGLRENCPSILEANAADLARGRENGMSASLLDRLRLTEQRVDGMAEGIDQLVELEDPIGEVMESFVRPNGMKISKIRVPMGVIGMIYEARPNVTADSSMLSVKAGSAVLLRGSGSALESNREITRVIRQALAGSGVPVDSVQLIEEPGHQVVQDMMRLNGYIDLLIPRGGAGLISQVVSGSSVPVLETGVGNCHVYLHADADEEMAMNIVLNAKVQRPSVCNAAETLLVHRDFLPKLGRILEALSERGVAIHADSRARETFPAASEATQKDYATEYLDLEMAVRTVDSLEEAIEHIDRYGTRHTECIVTGDDAAAAQFLRRVDAACVNHNVSTRFTDGFEFGFGAEIGISTQKLHARGPLGLREITTYKYIVQGNGQTRP